MKRLLTALLLALFVTVLFYSADAHASNMKKMKDLKMLGVFMNFNEPGNALDIYYDSDFSGGIRVGYGFTDEIGAFFSFSNFKFEGSNKIVGMRDTLSINCLQGNLFYKFNTPTKLHPYLSAGGGYYMINNGIDDIGINFGVGLMLDLPKLSEMTTCDISWNYHRIISREKNDPVFTEIRLGISLNFF